ncbi:MAG: hypothetical protein ACQES8_04570 [Thermodesulfobacteriota bacterium]
MVRGVELFREYFKDHQDKYILIGGTACDIVMSQMDLDFRVTRDLDIVLVVEAVDAEFSRLFWEFVRKGGYKNRQKSTGKVLFYRFYDPEDDAFPFMLELFSRKPDILTLPDDSHLTPIPIEEAESSLSAILLESDYYDFVVSGRSVTEDLSIIPQEYLIPLKVRAYLDLVQRRNAGGKVDSKDLKKHKNDVFRLYRILSPETRVAVPGSVAEDLRQFFDAVAADPPDLKNLGLKNTTIEEILGNLKMIYQL